MLRQQLFHASAIHFLTEHDKTNFEKTIDALQTDSVLYPHKLIKISEIEMIEHIKKFNLKEDISEIGGAERLKELKSKGVFVSGIYTADPLTDKDIFTLSQQSPISQESIDQDLIHILANRPNNVLCFGLVRKNKGIEEAMELAEELNKRGPEIKFILSVKLWKPL